MIPTKDETEENFCAPFRTSLTSSSATNVVLFQPPQVELGLFCRLHQVHRTAPCRGQSDRLYQPQPLLRGDRLLATSSSSSSQCPAPLSPPSPPSSIQSPGAPCLEHQLRVLHQGHEHTLENGSHSQLVDEHPDQLSHIKPTNDTHVSGVLRFKFVSILAESGLLFKTKARRCWR